MRAILIDPFERTITEVDYNGDFHQIYNLIDAQTFDAARVNDVGDAIFVDDEGLISGKVQAFFGFRGYPQPLAGKGLLLGCTLENGESADTTYTIEEAHEHVVWLSLVDFNGQKMFICTDAGETEH